MANVEELKANLLLSIPEHARTLKKMLDSGEIHQIHQKVYVRSSVENIPHLVERNWLKIAEHLYPPSDDKFSYSIRDEAL